MASGYTVAEHADVVRALLKDSAANWPNATIATYLTQALAIYSQHVPKIVRVDLTALLSAVADTHIDLSAAAYPSQSLVSIARTGSSSQITPTYEQVFKQWRISSSYVLFNDAAGSGKVFGYFKTRWVHDGTTVDPYPFIDFGVVCAITAALCMYSEQRAKISAAASPASAMFSDINSAADDLWRVAIESLGASSKIGV